MYLNLFIEARDKLGMSNNDFVFCSNINNITNSQNAEWYTGYDNLGKTAFLQSLARYVSMNFTANGVEKLMKRLEEKGILELDILNLKIRVTEKFKQLIQSSVIKINEAKMQKMEPKSQNHLSKQWLSKTLTRFRLSSPSDQPFRQRKKKRKKRLMFYFQRVSYPKQKTLTPIYRI